MGMEDKEFCKVGELAVAVMIETATAVTGNPYKVWLFFQQCLLHNKDVTP